MTAGWASWPVCAAIGLGAALGAWLRFFLSWALRAHDLTRVPLGTLSANWVGAYLIGWSMAFFMAHPALPPVWRLAVVTGFLGGLTTFSTFSYESVQLLQSGAWVSGLLHAALHLFGSIALTALGIASYHFFYGRG